MPLVCLFKMINPRKRFPTHIKRYRYECLMYLQEQLELGFNPQWLITYHYFTPEELLKALRETNNPYGIKDRVGFKSNSRLWNQVSRDKWIQKRREDLDWIIEDTNQIKNLELRDLYGVKRLNNKKKLDSVPPMMWFHEMGKVKHQYHTHQLLEGVLEEFNTKEILEDLFNNVFRYKRKCFSRWKKIDITPVFDPKGLYRYLQKETNINHLSFDPINSRIRHPENLKLI